MYGMKLTTVLALPLAFALTLGAAPGPAAAQTAGNVVCSGCVGSGDLKNGGVKRKDIGKNAITGAKVKNDSLAGADLKDEAGVEFVGVGPTVALATTPAVVRDITITAPVAGFAIVSAHGTFQFQGAADNAFCDLTLAPEVTAFEAIVDSGQNEFASFALIEGFAVAAGSNTFNLVCNTEIGNVVDVIRPVMTALFSAMRY